MAPKPSKNSKSKRSSPYVGYWYRKNRGWYTTVGRNSYPLCDEHGKPIKDAKTRQSDLREALQRFKTEWDAEIARQAGGGDSLVDTLVNVYLEHVQQNSKPSTYAKRLGFLFDFATGLPGRWATSTDTPTAADYIHDGYGKRTVDSIKPLDVMAWCKAHPGWKKPRMAIQTVKRMFSYCQGMGMIADNPVKSLKTGTSGKRVTFITPEQEAAMMEHATPAFAIALQVLIKTGARPFVEFGRLTAKHVQEGEKGMAWVFSPDESKTKKRRVIYCPADIAQIVRAQIAKYPSGPLFRNQRHSPWTQKNLKHNFQRLRKALEKKGVKLDKDCCTYACRHTYAKRMLGGYWSGKPCTLEVLAGLMGNSRQVCWESYAKWCGAYDTPLWDAVNG